MNALGIFAVVVFGIFVALYVAGMIRTYKMEHHEMQDRFEKGVANISSLDGDYNGVAHGYEQTSWQGKTLVQSSKTGSNRFVKEGAKSNAYPFAFYAAKGLRDKNLDVIVLDYNQAGNPWWLKFIVDEMVEVAPQEYLGKVHVNIMPGVVFTLGYFTLSK